MTFQSPATEPTPSTSCASGNRRASEEFDFRGLQPRRLRGSRARKNHSETISKVLYPNDKTESGKGTSPASAVFFVACSLKDIIRRFRRTNEDWEDFPEKVAIQLNDTHPAIAVVELQRLLHDEYGMTWEKAWSIVTRTFAYTNHTLLPEALEKWSVGLFQKVVPRHLQIIFEINERFHGGSGSEVAGRRRRRSRSSPSLKKAPRKWCAWRIFRSLAAIRSMEWPRCILSFSKRISSPNSTPLYPGKFNNKTNGITPRRWLLACNPRLSGLITSKIGHGWERDLDKLRALEDLRGRFAIPDRFHEHQAGQQGRSARSIIKRDCGVAVNPTALFDVQIKRLHEYKRQHLNLLHILALYRRLLQNPDLEITPRVFIFAAKAAPGYDMAKCIIKAINAVGKCINNDKRIEDRIKVVFLPNYRVSLAQRIVPAADLSEQISTAGKEASGTGNMKLALNGALTIGTLDGANVEIKEEVGEDNIFIFGHDRRGGRTTC